MSFFNAAPGDGTGYICDKVNEAKDNGILFVYRLFYDIK
jgi:hypothetical protein